jgi:hypothetical protein
MVGFALVVALALFSTILPTTGLALQPDDEGKITEPPEKSFPGIKLPASEEIGLLGEWVGEVASTAAGPTRMELIVESVGEGHIQGQQRFIGSPRGTTNNYPMKWKLEGKRITSSSGMWDLVWDGKDTITGICNCPSRQAEVSLRRRR